eukprot:4937651-Amphidinium_carterae.1
MHALSVTELRDLHQAWVEVIAARVRTSQKCHKLCPSHNVCNFQAGSRNIGNVRKPTLGCNLLCLRLVHCQNSCRKTFLVQGCSSRTGGKKVEVGLADASWPGGRCCCSRSVHWCDSSMYSDRTGTYADTAMYSTMETKTLRRTVFKHTLFKTTIGQNSYRKYDRWNESYNFSVFNGMAVFRDYRSGSVLVLAKRYHAACESCLADEHCL